MVFLGLLLAATAIAVGAAVVLDSSDPAELSIFGEAVPGITSEWHVFLTGAAVAIILMTGLMLAFFGIGRSVRTRRELRFLREEHEESITTLEMEKRQLQRELERFRRDDPTRQSPSDPRLRNPQQPVTH